MPRRTNESDVNVEALVEEVAALKREVAALKKEVSKRPTTRSGSDPRLDKIVEAISINPAMKRIVES
jgi:hypothetical protein